MNKPTRRQLNLRTVLHRSAEDEIYVTGNTTNPKCVVVCDVPTVKAFEQRHAMSVPASEKFREEAERSGFTRNDFAFIIPCPPFTEDMQHSEKQAKAFLKEWRERFLAKFLPLLSGAKLIMYMGKYAGHQVMGSEVKITEKRGQIHRESGYAIPVLPMLSPRNVLIRPEVAETFETDFRLAGSFKNAGWSFQQYTHQRLRGIYKWSVDLEEELDLDNPPPGLAVDIETKGLKWYQPDFRVLMVQLSWEVGKAVVVPLDIAYFNDPALRGETTRHLPLLSHRVRSRLIEQLRRLLWNARGVVGHNLKFDLHGLLNLGIKVRDWRHDTVQLAFTCDDNMQRKALSECVRRWIPEMAGYSDDFDREIDKEFMERVPHDKMLPYAGGDVDVARRLAFILVKLAKEDQENYRCYQRVQMPALREFLRMEREGLHTSEENLRNLGAVVKAQIRELSNALLNTGRKNDDGTWIYKPVSAEVKRRQLEKWGEKIKDPAKILSFTRDSFTIDVLFSPRSRGGRGHIPVLFTNETARLPVDQRVPSVSAKDHLIYFDEDPFVSDLIDLARLRKLQTTYIGDPEGYEWEAVKLLKGGTKYSKAAQDLIDGYELTVNYLPEPEEGAEPLLPVTHEFRLTEEKALVLDSACRPWWRHYTPPSGFWKYIGPDSRIHPGFYLDRTVTGRSASSDPNGQNIPKRGRTPRLKELVKAYRRIFQAPLGWVIIEADLSQAELRLVAWMAAEATMLRIYNMPGGDIHAATAAKVMGISLAEFNRLEDSIKKDKRFNAKAVNFGFIYGMWWRKFRAFARTDYGISITDEQAEQTRVDFFDLYCDLPAWHERMKQEAREKGYVRSLHGALRRLPSVWSVDEKVQQEAERQAINSPIQRFASDLGLMGLTIFSQHCPWEVMHPIGFIHDATVIAARQDYAEEAMHSIKWILENLPLLEWFDLDAPLPILADVSCGASLGDLEERPDISGTRPLWLPDGFENFSN